MPNDRPIEIDLFEDVVMAAVKVVRQTFAVALPGRVRSYARDQGRAAVDFGVRWLALNFTTQEEPPAPDLPHITPRGGGYGVYYDLDEGDMALVVACDRPVAGFYNTGSTVTPSTTNGHDYGCAVVLGGGRVSDSVVPTPPPNDAGTLLVGADDGSACVVFKGAGKPSPTEQGTVVVQARTHVPPSKALFLGGEAATLGVARLTDPVDRSALLTTWMSQVTAAINTLAPGSITPFVTPTIGTISGASDKVASE